MRALSFLIAIVLAGAAWATEPRRMATMDEQARFQAVGRLNVQGQGFCTATLIAPDEVLTAAHCLIDRRTGDPVRADRVHFLAGFRVGTYAAHGHAAQITLAPGYDRARNTIGRDLALVRLRAPLPAMAPAPLPVAADFDTAAPLSVLSYAMDRSQILSAELACAFESRLGEILFTDCTGIPGASGAPVLQQREGGLQVVAVVAAITGGPRKPRRQGAIVAVEITRERLAALRAAEAAATPAP